MRRSHGGRFPKARGEYVEPSIAPRVTAHASVRGKPSSEPRFAACERSPNLSPRASATRARGCDVSERLLIEPIYNYAWDNNAKRATLKGRRCRVVARGTMSSCLVEFIDNGQREVVSRRALRRVNV